VASSTYVPRDVAESWKAASEHLLSLGRAAALLSDEDFGTKAAEGLGTPEQLDQAIDAFKDQTEMVLSSTGGTSRLLSLVGGIGLVHEMLAASMTGDVKGMPVAKDHTTENASPTPDEWVIAMASPSPATPLPDELDKKLDALQGAGADELIALAGSQTMWAALAGFAGGIEAVGGAATRAAFEFVAGAVGWFRKKFVDLLQWILERFMELVPEPLRAIVDEQLDKIREVVAAKIPAAVAELIGYLLDRQSCETAWRKAQEAEKDLTAAKANLDQTVADELTRIGYVATGREKIDAIAAQITVWIGLAAPQVKIVVGAAALVVVVFVLYQVDEGFDQVKALVEI